MLIGNVSRLNSNPMRILAGQGFQNDLVQPGLVVVGSLDNQSSGFGSLAASPVGYYPPYSWLMPRKMGAISSHNQAYLTISVVGAGAMGLSRLAPATITIDAVSNSVRVGTPGSGTITIDATCSGIGIGTPGSITISLSFNGIPTGIKFTGGSSSILLDALASISSMSGAVGSCTITLTASATSYALGWADGAAAAQITASADSTPMINAPGSATISLTAEAISKALGHLVGDSDLEMTGEIISYALGWIAGNTIDVITAGITPETVARAVMNSTIGGTLTLEQAVRATAAVLTGKSHGGGTNTIVFRDTADTKDRVTATVDAKGNRTAVVLDLD